MKIGQVNQFSAPRMELWDLVCLRFESGQVRFERIFQEDSSGSGVAPPIARRGADDTCKDAREMALVREAAGDGHFGERSL